MTDILKKLQVLEEKIKHAETKYLRTEQETEVPEFLKTQKARINSLKKERSLYYQQLQSFKPSVAFLSPLYHLIERITPFTASRYA
jgi:cell shape-determining protein MreC